MQRKTTALGLVLMLTLPAGIALAQTETISMRLITNDGIGAPIGFIRAEDTGGGLKLTPELAGLPPGAHGFHVHEKPSCDPAERTARKRRA